MTRNGNIEQNHNVPQILPEYRLFLDDLRSYGLKPNEIFPEVENYFYQKNYLRKKSNIYDKNFKQAVSYYQRANFLPETGVLTMNVLQKLTNEMKSSNLNNPGVFGKKYQNVIFNYKNIEKNPQTIQEKDSIIGETKEKLNNQETQLTSEDLKDIGISRNEALEFSKNFIIVDPFDIEIFRQEIIKYQIDNNLEQTGKIDKYTYIDMKANACISDIEHTSLQNGLVKYQMQEILFITENGNLQNTNVMKVYTFVESYKTSPKYKNRIEQDPEQQQFVNQVGINKENFKKSPEGKRVQKNAENNSKSIYSSLKEWNDGKIGYIEFTKRIATDPTILFTAGVLFLFGVFGSNTKYTDSFMKRVGWLIGGAVLGPALLQKIGVGEMLDDISGKTNTNESETTPNIVSPKVKKAIEKATKEKTKEGEKEKIEIDEVYKSIFGKNENNKDNKDKYIEKEKLKVLQESLFFDGKFYKLKLEDLDKIKDIGTLYSYISDYSKKSLNNTKITNKDIKNFIDLVKGKFKKGDIIVLDIFSKKSEDEKVVVGKGSENNNEAINGGGGDGGLKLRAEEKHILLESFGLSLDKIKLNKLNKKLEKFGLENGIWKLLKGFDDYINNNLSNLDEKILDKIRKSIKIRTLNLGESIDDVIERAKDLGEENELSNFRWIVNSKIQDSFEEINNKILPSALLLAKYNESIDKAYFEREMMLKVKFEKNRTFLPSYSDKEIQEQKKEFFNTKIKEINEMFDAELDDNGEFDEWGIETINQSGTLQIDEEKDKKLFNVIGGNEKDFTDINILSETDQKIERNAMLFFAGAVALQMAIEFGPVAAGSLVPILGTTAGLFAGAVVGGTIDLVDTFSDRETLMVLLQKAGIVPKEYRMDKTWVDNILASIGLIPGVTAATKGAKLTKLISKFGFNKKEIEKSMKSVKKILVDGKVVNNGDTKWVTEKPKNYNPLRPRNVQVEEIEKGKKVDGKKGFFSKVKEKFGEKVEIKEAKKVKIEEKMKREEKIIEKIDLKIKEKKELLNIKNKEIDNIDKNLENYFKGKNVKDIDSKYFKNKDEIIKIEEKIIKIENSFWRRLREKVAKFFNNKIPFLKEKLPNLKKQLEGEIKTAKENYKQIELKRINEEKVKINDRIKDLEIRKKNIDIDFQKQTEAFNKLSKAKQEKIVDEVVENLGKSNKKLGDVFSEEFWTKLKKIRDGKIVKFLYNMTLKDYVNGIKEAKGGTEQLLSVVAGPKGKRGINVGLVFGYGFLEAHNNKDFSLKDWIKNYVEFVTLSWLGFLIIETPEIIKFFKKNEEKITD